MFLGPPSPTIGHIWGEIHEKAPFDTAGSFLKALESQTLGREERQTFVHQVLLAIEMNPHKNFYAEENIH